MRREAYDQHGAWGTIARHRSYMARVVAVSKEARRTKRCRARLINGGADQIAECGGGAALVNCADRGSVSDPHGCEVRRGALASMESSKPVRPDHHCGPG